MNRHRLVLVLMLLATTLLSGCFQVERTVTVRPDGSGTVEETFMMSRGMLEMMGEAFGGSGAEKKQTEDFAMPKEEQLKASAANMGEGVSYKGWERMTSDKFVGYRALYSFSDINKLVLSSSTPKPGQEAAKSDRPARFIFTPGKTATLEIIPPKSAKHENKPEEKTAKPEKPAEAPKKPTAEDIEMAKKLFDGMRVALFVKVDGRIVETNATHRDNNTVVIADIDFGKLLSISPEQISRLEGLKNADMAEAMAALKNMPGVKVDMNETLKIRMTGK